MMDSDLLVIGGGINGAGIARDAAGRGLKVILCDKGDLAGATSSASSKLIHGGLRYLESYEFRLVREALKEREVLLENAPHLVRPMRFVMPHAKELRPMWMIRAGLFLYDHLGGRRALPGSEALTLGPNGYGAGLKPEFTRGFTYFDCWADDARLVIANARSAADLGARVLPRTRFDGASVEDGRWRARLTDSETGQSIEIRTRGLLNAAGPWVNQIISDVPSVNRKMRILLVKGSHIAVPRIHDGDYALILQNDDGRVVFIIPFEGEYSVIGTTDVPIGDDPEGVKISDEEIDYLCRAVNRYLADPISPDQIKWTYAGVRPLYDDGQTDPSKVTRDYELEVQTPVPGCVMLNVFGGKLTTYRRLAEHALEKLGDHFPTMTAPWTHDAPLPGGKLPAESFDAFFAELKRSHGFIPPRHLLDIARRHGANCEKILTGASSLDDLGPYFGEGLYAREVDYLCEQEWARTAEDILWRRTKCGVNAALEDRERLENYLLTRITEVARTG